MTDVVRSIVRTATPIVVGFAVTLLAHLGINQPAVVSAIGSAAAIAYYLVVRVLEAKYPRLGVLLGAAGIPSYSSTTPAASAPAPATHP